MRGWKKKGGWELGAGGSHLFYREEGVKEAECERMEEVKGL